MSSLALTLEEIQNTLCYAAGFGSSYASASSSNQALVDGWIKSGLRDVYFVPGHTWSFLRPNRTLTTVASQWEYDLPDDFGGMCGDRITFAADKPYRPILVVGESQIRQMRSAHGGTGVPMHAAIRARGWDGATPQGWELLLHPAPDAAYVLTYRYNVEPLLLESGKRIYPPGGAWCAEMILEACMSKMEQRIEDAPGQHNALFRQKLAECIQMDRERFGARSVGLMTDPGVDEDALRSRGQIYVTVNNVLYE